jgi:DNA-binding NarL/FixJ family response regulator
VASPGVAALHADAVALAEAIRRAPYRDKVVFLDDLAALLVRLTAPAPVAAAAPADAPPAVPPLHVRLAAQVAVMRQQGLSIQRIAQELGTSTRTIGRAVEVASDNGTLAHQ